MSVLGEGAVVASLGDATAVASIIDGQ
jgi:hypothetical protein